MHTCFDMPSVNSTPTFNTGLHSSPCHQPNVYPAPGLQALQVMALTDPAQAVPASMPAAVALQALLALADHLG